MLEAGDLLAVAVLVSRGAKLGSQTMNRVAESISLSLEVRVRSHQALLQHLLLRAYRLKLLHQLAVMMLITFALF